MPNSLTISQLEKESTAGLNYSGVIEIPYSEFRELVLNNDDQLRRDIFEGKVFVVKGVYSVEELTNLRKAIHKYGQNTPPSFHKIQGKCPNFHNINEGNPLYKVLMRIHSYHFFDWNNDPVDIFRQVSDPLEVYETLCEYESGTIINNTWDDDVVPRLQIHHYPLGGGHTQMHRDPTNLVKVTWITMMTKRGVDYHTGGLYLLDLFGNKFYPEMELDLDVGDTIVFYPPLIHGVDAIDSEASSEWDSINGRWALIFNNLPVVPAN